MLDAKYLIMAFSFACSRCLVCVATEYKLSYFANELSFTGSATTIGEGLTRAMAEGFFWLICQVVTADTDRLTE